jgi:sulfur-carrier protein
MSGVIVHIPQQLRSYSGGAATARAQGASVDEVLRTLDARYAGLRFRVVDEQGRIRKHMRIFVDGERASDVLQPVRDDSEVHIFGALTGG